MARPMRILQLDFPYHVCTRTNGRKFRFKPKTFKLFIKILNDVVKKYDAKIQHFQLMVVSQILDGPVRDALTIEKCHLR